jgi:hypothetical protein
VLTFAVALALAVVNPPAAHLGLGQTRAPLAISSWCWYGHCGAPLSASTRVAVVPRGFTVHCFLAFEPKQATLTVAGHPVPVAINGNDLTWRVFKTGGITLRVQSSAGWIVYVGRLALERK